MQFSRFYTNNMKYEDSQNIAKLKASLAWHCYKLRPWVQLNDILSPRLLQCLLFMSELYVLTKSSSFMLQKSHKSPLHTEASVIQQTEMLCVSEANSGLVTESTESINHTKNVYKLLPAPKIIWIFYELVISSVIVWFPVCNCLAINYNELFVGHIQVFHCHM